MRYDMPLFRPPSEAGSLILQATIGCSHNRCTFCSMYRGKRFRSRPREELQREMQEARQELGSNVRRVFLADGDAMCLSARRLEEILDDLGGCFPGLARVGIYANARDVLSKSDEELAKLRARKLGILYMGLESGDATTLERVHKGATPEEIVTAVQRAREAGLSSSVMVLVGLAGRERSLVHARTSAEAINRMQPTYTALLTYTPTPGSPLEADLRRGSFELPSPEEGLREVRELVEHLSCRTYLTCNHASNYLPLKAKLPSGRARLLEALDAALEGSIPLKPEWLRGL
jgi:radical SAM superfamily enzyme YgiQ (UPF0313 family)